MASHIGKLPIAIPAGVEVKIEGQNFSAKGAKGVLTPTWFRKASPLPLKATRLS